MARGVAGLRPSPRLAVASRSRVTEHRWGWLVLRHMDRCRGGRTDSLLPVQACRSFLPPPPPRACYRSSNYFPTNSSH